ncbi:Na+/H+ antiporter NhaA [Streptomyces sp. NPDC048331]|uniref:Na+/H+ antiporter NhaA n=1 Tax=Streptomyces sp. NPDC048331 TaxID=3365534 RepID=UPI003719C94A
MTRNGKDAGPPPFLGLLPGSERRSLAEILRAETFGGLALLAAALIALVWANSPLSDTYEHVKEFHFGPSALGLHLSVAHWTADGLLAIFFLVAGIELKRELVRGELSTPATAALPIVAALCGMAVPAGLYVFVAAAGGGSLDGWAVPMATDIAFALAVLAVINTHLPASLRAFLLTLAVVDDLGAIVIIALFFTDHLNAALLLCALAGLAVFFLLQHFRVRGWWWYLPLGLTIWALTYNSGVHATVAGVAMGLLLRATPFEGEKSSVGDRTAHLLRPVSAAIAVPLFALFAAGVPVSGEALARVFTTPEPLGVVAGLVAGKVIGVFGGAWLAARFTHARLNPELSWADVLGLAGLAGIGFTIALLFGELAFPDGANAQSVTAAVLVASLISASVAGAVLRRRNAVYRHLSDQEDASGNGNGNGDAGPGAAADRDGC